MATSDEGRSGAVEGPPPEGSIRAMSFNVRYGTARDGPNDWDHRWKLVFDLVRTVNADIVGFQEVVPFQLEGLRDSQGDWLEFFGRGREADGSGEATPIAWRRDRFTFEEGGTYWLSGTPEVAASRTFGNRLPRIATWVVLTDKARGQTWTVVNTHLDHESQEARLASVALLRDRHAVGEDHGIEPPWTVGGRPSCGLFMGDLNVQEDNKVVKAILAGGLWRDTFREANPDVTEGFGTFTGFDGWVRDNKIDFMFVTPQVTTVAAWVDRTRAPDGRCPSDHDPIVATLWAP